MKKRAIGLFVFIYFVFGMQVFAQKSAIDSLSAILAKSTDTVKVKTLIKIGNVYKVKNNYDKALSNYLDALKLADSIQNKECLFLSLKQLASFYNELNQNDQALEFGLRAQKIAEEQGNKQNLYDILDLVGGFIYFNSGKYDKATQCGQTMMKIAEAKGDKKQIIYMQMWFGDLYRAEGKFDLSIEIYAKALQTAKEIGDKDYLYSSTNGVGMAYGGKGQFNNALKYYLDAFNGAENAKVSTNNYEYNVAKTYFELKDYPRALFYANRYLLLCDKNGDNYEKLADYGLLRKIYAATNKYKEAYNAFDQYHKLYFLLHSDDVQNKMNLLQAGFNAEKQTKEIEFLQNQALLQSKLKNVLIAAFIFLLVIILLVANGYRLKRKSGRNLSSKNNELNQAINTLRATQNQLIQSEKMASLGELTAGIAHEIQNPLNFVNNFSDVNAEMIAELEDELKSGNIPQALAIAGDIKENERKINHHGKRADAIVKGMLQHSKTGSGSKEPTDINALADEYMRLAYHGLRAKDKSFNSEMTTRFASDLPKINVLQQDMGRVMLNLFNNAFYAVNQKAKMAHNNYKPEVTISTSFEKGYVIIKVKDNGVGIPDAIKGKIMQPFFTTKPTGEGTGLGLSLTYDMVVKGHAGSITVDTKEGEYTVFTIKLSLA